MNDTVPRTADTGGSPPADLVAQVTAHLRAADIDTSDRAVRTLAIHAWRHRLTYDQVVQILAGFRQRRWSLDVRRRAGELLEDMGVEYSHEGAVELERQVEELAASRVCAHTPAWRSYETCVHALAGGAIVGLRDLCPPCLRRTTAALSAAVPGLAWHPVYRELAGRSAPVARPGGA